MLRLMQYLKMEIIFNLVLVFLKPLPLESTMHFETYYLILLPQMS